MDGSDWGDWMPVEDSASANGPVVINETDIPFSAHLQDEEDNHDSRTQLLLSSLDSEEQIRPRYISPPKRNCPKLHCCIQGLQSLIRDRKQKLEPILLGRIYVMLSFLRYYTDSNLGLTWTSASLLAVKGVRAWTVTFCEAGELPVLNYNNIKSMLVEHVSGLLSPFCCQTHRTMVGGKNIVSLPLFALPQSHCKEIGWREVKLQRAE